MIMGGGLRDQALDVHGPVVGQPFDSAARRRWETPLPPQFGNSAEQPARRACM